MQDFANADIGKGLTELKCYKKSSDRAEKPKLKKTEAQFFCSTDFFFEETFFAKFNLNGSVVFRESATTSNKFSRPRIDPITFRFSKKICFD